MFVGVILSLFLLLLLPRCKINIILNRAITNLIFSAVYDQHYIHMVLYVGFFLADVTSVQCQIYRENATAYRLKSAWARKIFRIYFKFKIL